MDNHELSLTPDELCATVEALRDALIRRVRWTVDPEATRWHQLEFPIVQAVIDQLASSYAKAWMLVQAISDELDPDFIKHYTFPPHFWDLANSITLARDWASSPAHNFEDHHSQSAATNCAICSTLSEA